MPSSTVGTQYGRGRNEEGSRQEMPTNGSRNSLTVFALPHATPVRARASHVSIIGPLDGGASAGMLQLSHGCGRSGLAIDTYVSRPRYEIRPLLRPVTSASADLPLRDAVAIADPPSVKCSIPS